MTTDVQNKGVSVTMAATGINLALGVLYTWSIFKGAISDSIAAGGPGAFAWDPATLNDPYSVCCLVFALTMILAGRCQDKLGPRRTAIMGGLLVGLGFLWISMTTSYWAWVLGFGGLVGAGIAFGYSSATPPALKWFPPHESGKIAGIVVSGFGLASVYIAPLATYLLISMGLSKTMLIFGIGFFVLVSICALFLVNPPKSFSPRDIVVEHRSCTAGNRIIRSQFGDHHFSPREMIRTTDFWRVWILYFIGAGAGLMVIGSVAGMAKSSLGDQAFWAVAVLAVGNAGGRIVAGFMADKMGRCQTLGVFFGCQALMMFIAAAVLGTTTNTLLLLFLLCTIGANYGANLALFPTFTRDLWGMKHFGVNYGLVFSAWGIGGFVMSRLSQVVKARFDSFSASFVCAGILLLIGMGVMKVMRDRTEVKRQQLAELKAG